MHYEITEFYTGLTAILSPVPETPRMALAVVIKGGISREPVPGMAKLANRLLLKGTETRSAEALAYELDARAIDLHEITLADCSVLLASFLNRELHVALEILEDILFHSTFADFEKERTKLMGEVRASLDMPAEQAQDLLIRTLFAGHPYGNTGTRLLEEAQILDQDGTQQWFLDMLNPREMNITLVGDFAHDEVLPTLDDTFADLIARAPALPIPAVKPLPVERLVTQPRPDAQQAQIYQGWLAPAVGSTEQAAMAVMNTILGSSGLSSRLFSELRDKQGLAYSVHSQYVPMRQVGDFIVSIGTSPENIAKARNGFAEQITRMQNEPVTLSELEQAKGKLRGTFVLSHETNRQRCMDMAINQLNGLGPEYSAQLLERIEGVTTDEVLAAAQRIAPPSVTAIVAREDALPIE